MEKSRAIELLRLAVPIKALTQQEYADFVEAVNMGMDALNAQLSQEGTTSDLISKFIDDLDEIFAHIREKHVDDSVCGLCEYDGAYIGQSGDWCNECPGFERDDCFKLSDKTRKEWTDEIIKALPTVQPEPQVGHWIKHIDPFDGEQYECSRCGVLWEFNDGTPEDNEAYFCPKCGTKMKGVTK